MSGEYRKPYSDKTHFSVPADAQDYSDDIHGGQNGNGIYNDYTVELQPREYSPTFKLCGITFENSRKTKCMLLSGLVTVCVLVIVIIVIASNGKPSDESKTVSAPPKEKGLIAYGPDADGKIAFNPSNSLTYMPYVKRIEAAMHDYGTIHQYANHEVYTSCNDSTTTVPDGQVCRYTAELFGDKCQNSQLYGLDQGRPCVLLILKLPQTSQPIPYNYTEGQNVDVKNKMHERASSTAVGISCEGKTPEDAKHITKDKHTGEIIDYHPATGFPLYSFLARDHDGYVSPAVMVQFNTITTNRDITVKCTAWAQNLKDPMYSTEFTFHLV